MDNSLLLGLLAKGGGGSPEGSAIKSTGEAAGKVLMTDGADGAIWVSDMTEAEVEAAVNAELITVTVTNGTYSGDSVIAGTATVTIAPSTGYEAPASITVNGVTGTSGSTGVTWSYSNGVISLSNATDDVEISATCPAQPTYSHFTIANLPSDPDYPYVALKVLGCHTTDQYISTFKYNDSEYSTSDKCLWIPIENGEFTKKFLLDFEMLISGTVAAIGTFVFIKSPTPITEGFGNPSESGKARVTMSSARLELFKQDGTRIVAVTKTGSEYISFSGQGYNMPSGTTDDMYYTLSVT